MSRVTGGLLAYVRPTFMLPAVGMSVYAAVLAPGERLALPAATLHAFAAGAALYVAHLRDGYVDGHHRGEETPRLSVPAFRWAIRLGAGLVLALAAALGSIATPIAGLSVLGLLALALAHAPYLDQHPVTVTVDYPLGIALVVIGGYATQSAIDSRVLAVAAAFFGLLAGIKISIDALDADFDRSIDKQTIPVRFGSVAADRIAAGIFGATAVWTVAIAVAGVVGVLTIDPLLALAAAVGPLGCLGAAVTTDDERTVRLQMGLTYAFAASLFFAVCNGRCVGAAFLRSAGLGLG